MPDESHPPTLQAELVEFLGGYVTENKRQKIEAALDYRTRHITIMLEEIYQPHNASACLRNCDCLGVQDVHIVENLNEYRPKPGVSMGSAKWLSLHRYRTAGAAMTTLRNRGYRIVATTPEVDGFTPATLPLDRPVALLFGTEERGLTDAAIAAADDTLRLPMYGFTQSFNVSVSVAIALYHLVERLHASSLDWHLAPEERARLTLEWYRRIVRRHETYEEAFWNQQASP